MNKDIRGLITLVEAKSKQDLTLEKLPYSRDELSPAMSKETIEYHYNKLARGYVERYNKGEGDSTFNEAGAFLHNIFFPQLMPPKNGNSPKGVSLDLINRKFKSFSDFKEQFAEQAMKIQGSGWIYLSKSGDIKTIKNHEIKKDIALLVDWWEHAWALDYQSDKKKYLQNMWRIINWDTVNSKLEK